MYVEQMREEIMHAYSGPAWRYRVQGMDKRQVIAIYHDMKESGRLEMAKKEKKRGENNALCEQLTIWDFLKEDQQDANIN